MDLVQEIEGAVETSSIDYPFAFDRDILLSLCEQEAVVAFDHVIVVGIGGSYKDGAFQKPDLNIRFEVDTSGKVASDREFQHASPILADEVYAFLDGPGVKGDTVGLNAECRCLVDFLGQDRE